MTVTDSTADNKPAIPRVPKTITSTEAKNMWRAIWQTKAEQLIPAQDVFIVTLICETIEQRSDMLAEIKTEGNTVWINDGKTLVLHPLHKHVQEATKQITGWLKDLGFSPKDRAALALEAAKTEESSMNIMRARLEAGEY